MIKFATNDSFWQSNILSPDKLRKQYDRLVIKMQSSKPPKKLEADYSDADETAKMLAERRKQRELLINGQ